LSLLTSFSLGSSRVLASSMCSKTDTYLFSLPDRTLSRLLRIYSFVDLASSLASQGGASFLDPPHVSCVVVCIDSLVGNSVFSKFAMSCHVVLIFCVHVLSEVELTMSFLPLLSRSRRRRE
jgi:hypothetical protein